MNWDKEMARLRRRLMKIEMLGTGDVGLKRVHVKRTHVTEHWREPHDRLIFVVKKHSKRTDQVFKKEKRK